MPLEADKFVLLPRWHAPPHLGSRTVARSPSAFEQRLEPKIAVPMPSASVNLAVWARWSRLGRRASTSRSPPARRSSCTRCSRSSATSSGP